MIEVWGFSEPFSSWSHLLSAVVSLVMAVPLIRKGRGNAVRVWGLAIFSFSFVFLFSMSGVYHLLSEGTAKHVMQRMDHAAIWIMIAGSFTPPHLIMFRGFWRWGFLSMIWVIAITGLVLKTVYFREMGFGLGIFLYLGLGWLGVISGVRMGVMYGYKRFRWWAAGGIFYTFGALLEFSQMAHFWPRVIETHEIFHLFVMAGAFSHWVWIWEMADKPYVQSLLIHVRRRPGPEYHAQAYGEDINIIADSRENLLMQLREIVDQKYAEGHPLTEVRLQYAEEEDLVLKSVP